VPLWGKYEKGERKEGECERSRKKRIDFMEMESQWVKCIITGGRKILHSKPLPDPL
jgi:hypothetical protein